MAHPDLEKLLNDMLPFAKGMLEKHGGFHPFASVLDTDGKLDMIAPYDDNNPPRTEALVALIDEDLTARARHGHISAVGVCVDVRVVPPNEQEKTDAIRLELEHRSGNSAYVFLPYQKRTGDVIYGSIFGVAQTPRFFATKIE